MGMNLLIKKLNAFENIEKLNKLDLKSKKEFFNIEGLNAGHNYENAIKNIVFKAKENNKIVADFKLNENYAWKNFSSTYEINYEIEKETIDSALEPKEEKEIEKQNNKEESLEVKEIKKEEKENNSLLWAILIPALVLSLIILFLIVVVIKRNKVFGKNKKQKKNN